MFINSSGVIVHLTDNLGFLDALLASESKLYGADDVLVVTDLNYTLVYPVHPCLHTLNIKKYEDTFLSIVGGVSQEVSDIVINNAFNTRNRMLVNEDTPGIISKHVDAGVNFIVCSRSLATERDLGIISNVLKHNSVRLKDSYSSFNYCKFSEFNEYLSNKPLYSDCIIMTNREKKSDVLDAFFSRLTRLPKSVVFVDDKKGNISDIARMSDLYTNVKFELVVYKDSGMPPPMYVSREKFAEYWEGKISAVVEEDFYEKVQIM